MTPARRPVAAAEVLADSLAPHGGRLTTFRVRYPLVVDREVLTHRALSRNGASTRALRTEAMADSAEADPFVPDVWRSRGKGMQPAGELDPAAAAEAEAVWRGMVAATLEGVRRLAALGLAKELAGRPLEWFSYTTKIITSAGMRHFHALRGCGLAQREVGLLSRAMSEAADASVPRRLRPGEWHLPLVDGADREDAVAATSGDHAVRPDLVARFPYLPATDADAMLVLVSAARCARVSYLPPQGAARDRVAELGLADRLSRDGHASPFEHQATPDERATDHQDSPWLSPHRHGNLAGWLQARKYLEGEFTPG